MSSAVISTSAALGRPFLFHAEPAPEVCSAVFIPLDNLAALSATCLADLATHRRSPLDSRQDAGAIDPKLAGITPASRLAVRPAPEMASSGIPALDALTGGLPRGCLTEICGPASSGRTSVLLSALAAATQRGEFCVLVDASDALDPQSLAAASIDLDKLLWVRCADNSPQRGIGESKQWRFRARAKHEQLFEQRLEQVLRSTDMLLESGGFGLIALDLADLPARAARRIPLTTWFRFRRAVEHKPTILLALEQQPIAGSCSSLVLKTSSVGSRFSVRSSNTQLLTGLDVIAEVTHARLGRSQSSNSTHPKTSERKPAASVSAAFTSRTAWG